MYGWHNRSFCSIRKLRITSLQQDTRIWEACIVYITNHLSPVTLYWISCHANSCLSPLNHGIGWSDPSPCRVISSQFTVLYWPTCPTTIYMVYVLQYPVTEGPSIFAYPGYHHMLCQSDAMFMVGYKHPSFIRNIHSTFTMDYRIWFISIVWMLQR